MPHLSTKPEITTTTEVELSARLTTQLKEKLTEYRANIAKAKVAKATADNNKTELETLFADADEYDALVAGVSVDTPFGAVSMKIIGGKTAPKLNMQKVMKKFKITTKQLASCYDPSKDKAEYLGIYLPDEDKAQEER